MIDSRGRGQILLQSGRRVCEGKTVWRLASDALIFWRIHEMFTSRAYLKTKSFVYFFYNI